MSDTPMAVYRLKKDDGRFGMKAGDLLLCTPYWLDPHSKGTVVARITDGFNPECNVYWSQVEKLTSDQVFELRAAAPASTAARDALLAAADDAERHIGLGSDIDGDAVLIDGPSGKEVTVHSWLRERAAAV